MSIRVKRSLGTNAYSKSLEGNFNVNIYHRHISVKVSQQRVENPFHPTKHFESSKYLPRILKFIYSEKATKFCEIFTLFLTGTV